MSFDVALVIQNAVRRDGQGRVMVEIAEELLRRGHRVTIYAHRVDGELASRAAVRRIPKAPGPQIVDDVVMLARATRAVGRGNHDVACVLGHSAVPRCPTVFNAQFSHRGWRASWASGGRPRMRHRLHTRLAGALERWCVARADHVIASTPRLAGDVAAGLDVPVTVVSNGVDLDEFGPVTPDERAAARAALGLSTASFVIGFLGDYSTPRKGLEPLVHALALGRPDDRLVVAARGDDDQLGRLTRSLGIEDRVVVAGFAPPRQVIASADAVAVPSLYEPFSLVAFEATACGVPVVVSACAGAAVLLGEGAVVVDDPHDPAALRKGLDAVRDDPELGWRAVAEGRRVLKTLTWEASAGMAVDTILTTARGVSR